MRLYYRPQKGRPMRVAWVLGEIGVEYEPVAVASAHEAAEPPEPVVPAPGRAADTHHYRHPLGRVPALELDDGQVLFDSTAIVLTVADLHPDAGLIGPPGSPLRNQVYAWSLTAMTELERAALGAWARTEHVEDEYRAGQRRAFALGSAAVGDQLKDQPFLLGEALTAADIVLGGVLAVAQLVEVLDAAPTNVIAYFERLQGREAYRLALTRTESLLRGA